MPSSVLSPTLHPPQKKQIPPYKKRARAYTRARVLNYIRVYRTHNNNLHSFCAGCYEWV